MTLAANANGDRLRVPAYLTCDRNEVTSWTGEVTSYMRKGGRLQLQVLTDAETLEHLLLKTESKNNLQRQFYLDNTRFIKEQWNWLEDESGELNEPRFATVWLCLDEKTLPVINWIKPVN